GGNYLGRGNVVQHYRVRPRRICDFVWIGTGCDDGGRVMGCVHLEGIPYGARGNFAADRGDVWMLRGGTCADYPGANFVGSFAFTDISWGAFGLGHYAMA